MDALADMVRSYFSVDVLKDEDGNEEMVVMTSPEFLGFLLVRRHRIVQAGSVPRGHLPGDARRPTVAMSVSNVARLGLIKC